MFTAKKFSYCKKCGEFYLPGEDNIGCVENAELICISNNGTWDPSVKKCVCSGDLEQSYTVKGEYSSARCRANPRRTVCQTEHGTWDTDKKECSCKDPKYPDKQADKEIFIRCSDVKKKACENGLKVGDAYEKVDGEWQCVCGKDRIPSSQTPYICTVDYEKQKSEQIAAAEAKTAKKMCEDGDHGIWKETGCECKPDYPEKVIISIGDKKYEKCSNQKKRTCESNNGIWNGSCECKDGYLPVQGIENICRQDPSKIILDDNFPSIVCAEGESRLFAQFLDAKLTVNNIEVYAGRSDACIAMDCPQKLCKDKGLFFVKGDIKRIGDLLNTVSCCEQKTVAPAPPQENSQNSPTPTQIQRPDSNKLESEVFAQTESEASIEPAASSDIGSEPSNAQIDKQTPAVVEQASATQQEPPTPQPLHQRENADARPSMEQPVSGTQAMPVNNELAPESKPAGAPAISKEEREFVEKFNELTRRFHEKIKSLRKK
ncbi:MAG: hypothetical protein LBB08_01000 [Rickettsiales bacterium]|nr:hypothetical protein [Rickettsiales bacterium]